MTMIIIIIGKNLHKFYESVLMSDYQDDFRRKRQLKRYQIKSLQDHLNDLTFDKSPRSNFSEKKKDNNHINIDESSCTSFSQEDDVSCLSPSNSLRFSRMKAWSSNSLKHHEEESNHYEKWEIFVEDIIEKYNLWVSEYAIGLFTIFAIIYAIYWYVKF